MRWNLQSSNTSHTITLELRSGFFSIIREAFLICLDHTTICEQYLNICLYCSPKLASSIGKISDLESAEALSEYFWNFMKTEQCELTFFLFALYYNNTNNEKENKLLIILYYLFSWIFYLPQVAGEVEFYRCLWDIFFQYSVCNRTYKQNCYKTLQESFSVWGFQLNFSYERCNCKRILVFIWTLNFLIISFFFFSPAEIVSSMFHY